MLTDSKIISRSTPGNDTIGYNKYYQYIYNDFNVSNNYNSFYEQNRNNIAIEKSAIDERNPNTLYYAAVEQTKVLNNLVVTVRNTTQSIRKEIVDDINYIIPDESVLKRYEEALGGSGDIREKLVRYKVNPITYPNMATFLGLFRNEVLDYLKINNKTSDVDDPFKKQYATKFLISNTETYAKTDINILDKEAVDILTKDEMYQILLFFKKKGLITVTVEKDFRTFYMYLREFKLLNEIIKEIRPTQRTDGSIQVGDNVNNTLSTFNDYLILYKHYCMIIRYMIETISYYESTFFNKIYAIQSNIQSFRSLIDTVISKYATRMRNVNESIDDVNATLGDYTFAKAFLDQTLNDDISPAANVGEDKISGINLPHSVVGKVDPDDDAAATVIDAAFMEADKVDLSELDKLPAVKEGRIYPNIGKSVCDKTIGTMLDAADLFINSYYESTSPRDILRSRRHVIREAEELQGDFGKILQGIRDSIVASNAKFKDDAHEVHEEYGDLHQKGKNLDIQSIDLSGIEFQMYNYPKGVDVMHRIRIPSYRDSDSQLLLDQDGVGYKDKYFKSLYYFSQREVPINLNKMRGSISQKSVQEYDPNTIFAWAIEFIENYDKVISAVSHANSRITAAIDQCISLISSSYGGDDAQMVEAIILNRSIFRDEIYDILMEQQMQPAPVQQPQEQVPQEQPQQQMNIDDTSAQAANDDSSIATAMRNYVKIAYEVNSSRMLIYQEALENAFQFLKLVLDSLGNQQPSSQPAEEAPQEEQVPQEQPQEQVPQEQPQQPQQ